MVEASWSIPNLTGFNVGRRHLRYHRNKYIYNYSGPDFKYFSLLPLVGIDEDIESIIKEIETNSPFFFLYFDPIFRKEKFEDPTDEVVWLRLVFTISHKDFKKLLEEIVNGDD